MKRTYKIIILLVTLAAMIAYVYWLRLPGPKHPLTKIDKIVLYNITADENNPNYWEISESDHEILKKSILLDLNKKSERTGKIPEWFCRTRMIITDNQQTYVLCTYGEKTVLLIDPIRQLIWQATDSSTILNIIFKKQFRQALQNSST